MWRQIWIKRVDFIKNRINEIYNFIDFFHHILQLNVGLNMKIFEIIISILLWLPKYCGLKFHGPLFPAQMG
tara:strand:+ start:307 stop:519 length:213 start_codon:yes stop_codon:yes gene_type:complete